jgi:hypothetical protein
MQAGRRRYGPVVAARFLIARPRERAASQTPGEMC